MRIMILFLVSDPLAPLKPPDCLLSPPALCDNPLLVTQRALCLDDEVAPRLFVFFFCTVHGVFVIACAKAAACLPVSVASSSLSARLGVSAFSNLGFSFRIGFAGGLHCFCGLGTPFPPSPCALCFRNTHHCESLTHARLRPLLPAQDMRPTPRHLPCFTAS